jgi:signal transduction histidine kinase/CheY-like chemotaxis protein
MHRVEKLYIEIPALRAGSMGAYAFSLGMAGAAALLRLAIDPYVTGVQYITFFPAVIVTALISGFRAGLLCVFSCGLAAWFLVVPQHAQGVQSEQILGLALFAVVATIDVLLISALRLAIERYREFSRDLERRVQERTAELVKTQQMLSQAQKMEAIGQLTGGLAHDFNNMIAVVLGNLDIMRRRLMAGQTDIVRYVDNAMDGGQRAAQLTQRLLAFARHQPLSPVIVDVNKLALGMSELLRRTLGERIALECVQAGGLWKARVDPAQLENALINLAVNARDAMPDGGALTIETANAYLDERYAAERDEVTPGQYVVLAVSDTGTGMPPEVAARAVEPFFTTKEAGTGTGLGLSQVFGFVKQSGGHMAIYSEESRGTTVRIYLPRSYGPAEVDANGEAVADTILPTAAEGDAILVVEDDDHVRRMSVEALRELGYRVVEAGSGAEALELLKSQPQISLLFTDVVMPEMDGRKLASAAKEQRPGLKVLYTTGYTRNAIVHDGTLDAGVALIVKPFTVDQLARKVRAVLESENG